MIDLCAQEVCLEDVSSISAKEFDEICFEEDRTLTTWIVDKLSAKPVVG